MTSFAQRDTPQNADKGLWFRSAPEAPYTAEPINSNSVNHKESGVGLPSPPIPNLSEVELSRDGEQTLQAFFEANPLHFLTLCSVPAPAGDAREEICAELQAGWDFSRTFCRCSCLG
jgi:hypothetical protein